MLQNLPFVKHGRLQSSERKIRKLAVLSLIAKTSEKCHFCELFGISFCALFGINENLSINAESGASAAKAVFLRYPAMNAFDPSIAPISPKHDPSKDELLHYVSLLS